jgi:hypothetical protein
MDWTDRRERFRSILSVEKCYHPPRCSIRCLRDDRGFEWGVRGLHRLACRARCPGFDPDQAPAGQAYRINRAGSSPLLVDATPATRAAGHKTMMGSRVPSNDAGLHIGAPDRLSENRCMMTRARTALITGTSTGIGLALTRTVLEDGWVVIATSRSVLPGDAALRGAARPSNLAEPLRPNFQAPLVILG